MKIKFLFALVVAGIIGFSSTIVLTHNTPPLHYHVGEVQPFQGLVCKDQEPAMHIFNTWIEDGVVKSREVFLVYRNAGECKFLVGPTAYFIEKIISSEAPYYDGTMKNVLVFSVSPVGRRDLVDFLVTWEDLGRPI